MVQARVASLMSFEAFLEWYPEDGRRYEPTQLTITMQVHGGDDNGALRSIVFH